MFTTAFLAMAIYTSKIGHGDPSAWGFGAFLFAVGEFFLLVHLLTASDLATCLDAGMQWIDGDCVK
jgi:hypothetical protein